MHKQKMNEWVLGGMKEIGQGLLYYFSLLYDPPVLRKEICITQSFFIIYLKQSPM